MIRRVGVTSIEIELNVPTLSKAELIKLGERSGSFVHRGSAKDLLAAQGKPIVVNLDPVIEWGQKILNLLEQHFISSADKKSHLLVALSHVESRGDLAFGWPLRRRGGYDTLYFFLTATTA
jgi:hypothetical protein